MGDRVRRRVRDLVVREERALRRLQQCRGRHFDFKNFRLGFLICLCGYSCEERQRGGCLGTRRKNGNNGDDSSDVYTHLSKDSMLTFFRVSTSDKIEFMYQWQFCITFLIDISDLVK